MPVKQVTRDCDCSTEREYPRGVVIHVTAEPDKKVQNSAFRGEIMDPDLANILSELNQLTREQLDSFDAARHRSLSFTDAGQYQWRNERIRALLEQLETVEA